jgi:methylenetetrahydrofolate dehydrogenase (NADP+)/methenyltetrahydrofolate cyclohydrolase
MILRAKESAVTATIIDGTAVAARLRGRIAAEVAELKAKHGLVPGLATVLVGDNPASQAYVRSKGRACEQAGIYSTRPTLPSDATQAQVEGLVRDLNNDPSIDGILVQLPLPGKLDEEAILSAISLHKDVDGFSPVNIGRLMMKGREPLFVPCTPAGCIVLIQEAGTPIEGADAVVLGRSNIVGIPVAGLLRNRNATVTVCHSRTKDLPGRCRSADILVAAIGRPQMVRGDWIKPGATVIDVGINRVDDLSSEKGSRLVGDVAYDEAVQVAGAITPVPGGVGPMTIAMLLQNTLTAFHYRLQRLGLE